MKKKKIVAFGVSIMSLIAVSSVTATLAWYFNGVYAQIDQVTITLKGEPNLKISTSNDLTTFKETLTKDELIKVDKFNPVSSMYSRRWTEQKQAHPSFVDDYSHLEDSDVPFYAISGYYSQDLYLLSDDDVIVTFNSKTFSFAADEAKNEQAYESVRYNFPTLKKEEIIANLNSINKSLRAAILIPSQDDYDFVIYDPYKTSETNFAGVIDENLDGYFDYDKNADKETVYGDYNDATKFVYDAAPSQDIPYTGINTCFNSGHKKDIEMFNLSKSIDAGLLVGQEDSVGPEQIENELKIALEEGVPKKINLSIYLEGWDLDNTILMEYASFLADIQFKIKEYIL